MKNEYISKKFSLSRFGEGGYKGENILVRCCCIQYRPETQTSSLKPEGQQNKATPPPPLPKLQKPPLYYKHMFFPLDQKINACFFPRFLLFSSAENAELKKI
jgi:hypothetical protein